MRRIACVSAARHARIALGSFPSIKISQLVRSFGANTTAKHKFIDRMKLDLKAGTGGDGCVAHESVGSGKFRPCGGNGGGGGSIYLVATHNMTSISIPKSNYNAQNGDNGKGSSMAGRAGQDLHINVPVGTIVTDVTYEEMLRTDYGFDWMEDIEEGYDEAEGDSTLDSPSERKKGMVSGRNDAELPPVQAGWFGSEDSQPEEKQQVELLEPGETLLVARGGKGGQGNVVLASLLPGSATGRHSTPGEKGQRRIIQLELKTIADVGLVGMPNAGKSSLLQALTKARPKIAPYPFTTLHPVVGTVEYSDYFRLSVADIPGLIEGAHMDRGLGLDFLRHIERTKALLFVLDLSGVDEHDPVKTLQMLKEEISAYDTTLADRPAIIFLNKTDLVDLESYASIVKRLKRKFKKQVVIAGSAASGEGLDKLAQAIRETMTAITTQPAPTSEVEGLGKLFSKIARDQK